MSTINSQKLFRLTILFTILITNAVALQSRCVTFYQHCNYRGRQQTVCRDGRVTLNDQYSSWKLGPHTVVQVFFHYNYGGSSFFSGSNLACLHNHPEHGNFNDQISSFRIYH